MNLSNLKPAWQKFQLLNSMQLTDQEEILLMLERAEGMALSKTHKSIMSAIMFIVLTFFCQAG